MDAKDLNSLARFSKESDRLLLEQYAHCEVPAGCGGVVMRWRNPKQGRPVRLHTVLKGNVEAWINGQAYGETESLLLPGEHLLAIHFSEIESDTGPLVVAMQDFSEKVTREGFTKLLKSESDGSWLMSTSPPADDAWIRPDYDDSAWSAMERPEGFDPEKLDSSIRWRYRWCAEEGADPLTVPTTGEFWLRKRFTIAVEE